MPGKTRKKATPRKRVGKNDQILTLLIDLDNKFTEKFEALDNKFTEKFEGLDNKFTEKFEGLDNKFTEKFEGLDNKFTEKFEGLDNKFTEKFEGLSQKVERMDHEAKAEREKNAEEHEITRSYLRKFETAVLRRLDAMDLNILGFKSEILSVADVTRKEYDETKQERIVIGAVQDQQRSEIETLKLAEEKQNRALAALDTRVTALEMNKAA